jgi:threonyl-tRNA synthetase
MNEDKLNHMRYYAALLLAQAVQRQYEGAKLGLAAVTEQGFYYDLDVPGGLSDSELAGLEDEMRRIASDNVPYAYECLSKQEALLLFEGRNENWKTEWMREAAGEEVVIVRKGAFIDVVPSMESEHDAIPEQPAFKLLNTAGAYWRSVSNRPMLQRIYGAAFASAKELAAFVAGHEEALKRDHRKLGQQLELFMFAEEAPGMPFFLPKGTIVRQELEQLARDYLVKYACEEVRTPIIMNRRMWEQSGHWDHYRDNMYFSELDNHQFAVKPMNCPGHMLIFKHRRRSYRELPLRLAEFGQVHRHEFSGALNGLFRVRTFCQDDAHLFVTPDQIEAEIKQVIAMIREIYAIFGFEYRLELSTRPDDSMGSDEQWEAAEKALARVLEDAGLPYSINEGDGAFYGPKIDFHIRDALNRSHQCGTVQLDFQMPEKFGLSYVDEHNEKQTPIVIHRAVYGSIDRFLGILLEHYAGALPIWLAPVQAIILPVSEAHESYAADLCRKLMEFGIRAEVDERNEKLGYRIREAQMQKIPYTLVVGDAEQASGALQVRRYGHQEQEVYDQASFIGMMQERIRLRN